MEAVPSRVMTLADFSNYSTHPNSIGCACDGSQWFTGPVPIPLFDGPRLLSLPSHSPTSVAGASDSEPRAWGLGSSWVLDVALVEGHSILDGCASPTPGAGDGRKSVAIPV